MANNNIFDTVMLDRPKKSRFDFDHEVKGTTSIGRLTPVLCEEVLPGDNVRLSSEAFIRLNPTLAPFMHKVDVFIHHFYVANRVVSQGQGENNMWQKFITGGKDGTLDIVPPHMTLANIKDSGLIDSDPKFQKAFGVSSIWTYLGLPSLPSLGIENLADWDNFSFGTREITLWKFAALGRIVLDYYADENFLPDSFVEEDGINNQPLLHEGLYDANNAGDVIFLENYVLLLNDIYYRGYEKDYFTACLPWPQRGVQVLIPIIASGTVTYLPQSEIKFTDGTGAGVVDHVGGTGTPFQSGLEGWNSAHTSSDPVRIENIDEVTFTNTTVTVSDFRTAIVLQQWAEISARGGFKYEEQMLSHFDKKIPDYRLNKAEYLGGGRSVVQIGEVPATSTSQAGEDEIPQGNLAGRAISYQDGANSFTFEVPEHGHIISVMSVRPRTGYFQGLHKSWTRMDRYSYAWPSFANLSEEPVYSDELIWEPDNSQIDTVFGYNIKDASYKYVADRVVGEFQTTRAYWHLARVLDREVDAGMENSLDFIMINPEENQRIFAIPSGDNIIFTVYHNMSMIRPLPYYAVPGVQKI